MTSRKKITYNKKIEITFSVQWDHELTEMGRTSAKSEKPQHSICNLDTKYTSL